MWALMWWRRSNKKDVGAGCRMQSTKRARTQEDKEPAHSLTLGQGMDLIF